MSQEFFRANVSSEVSNPLGIYGGTRCAVGVVFVCVAGWFLTDLSSTIKEVIATEGAVLEHQPVLTSGRLALVVFAALWLVVGVRMVVGGARGKTNRWKMVNALFAVVFARVSPARETGYTLD